MTAYHGVTPQISRNKAGEVDDSHVLRDGTIKLLDERIVYFQIWSESELVYLSCFFSKQGLAADSSLDSLIAYLAEQGFKGVSGYQQPSLQGVTDDNGVDCWNVSFLFDDGE